MLWYIFLSTGCLFLLINIYLWFLALAGLWPQKKKKQANHSLLNKFIVIVPAHNESKVIKRTLDSIKKLDYPEKKYKTVVVADNCSDDTADIVKNRGVTCLERVDSEKKGKGFALQWVFNHINGEEYDAVVIIDADTLVETDFLRVMNQLLCAGEKAIQGYYDVLDPEKSPIASLSYLGFVLNRNLRYKGRSRLGWSSNLLGNGMCFSREVVEKFEWDGTSIVEDIEYEMRLVLNGIRVVFAPEAKVYAEIPDSFKNSKVQRARWDLGKIQVRNKYLFKLVNEGIRQSKLIYFDCALELLIPPYSLFCALVAVLFLSITVFSWGNHDILFFFWVGNTTFLILYSLIGLMIAQASWRIYKNLLYAPFFLFWRLMTVFTGYLSNAGNEWLKTQR
jgi:cellulose synthase/poly-beta-1,6-N-acetylglucosamine synthase-like glycosyltransferase